MFSILLLPKQAIRHVPALLWPLVFPLSAPAADVPVRGFTDVAIQRAIDQLPSAGGRIVLRPGTYTLASHLLIRDKRNLTITGNGSARLLMPKGSVMIWLMGNLTNLKISGLNLTNTATAGGAYGLISSNETARINGLVIESCTFSAPALAINGIKLNAESGGVGNYQTNIRIIRNRFVKLGRMGIELQNHGWERPGNAAYYFDGITVDGNEFAQLGLANEYGMAVSVSGLGQRMRITNNRVTDARGIAYEVVGGRQVQLIGNVARSVNTRFVGISVTDNDHHVTRDVTIRGNTIQAKGRAIQVYGAERCTIVGNTFTAGQSADFIMSNSLLAGNEIHALDHNVLIFDNGSADNVIRNNSLSNLGFGDCYALISFRGQRTQRNAVTANRLLQGIPGNRPVTEQVNGATANTATGSRLN